MESERFAVNLNLEHFGRRQFAVPALIVKDAPKTLILRFWGKYDKKFDAMTWTHKKESCLIFDSFKEAQEFCDDLNTRLSLPMGQIANLNKQIKELMTQRDNIVLDALNSK